MQTHRNAKLGLSGRFALVQAREAGLSVSEVARRFSISPATVSRWSCPWQAASVEERRTLACLFDRSSRPQRMPRLLAAGEQRRICAARRQTPGDLLHADWTLYARFLRPGHARTGDRTSTAAEKKAKPGYDYPARDRRRPFASRLCRAAPRRQGGDRHRLHGKRLRTPKRRPQPNGKVERFHQTMAREWTYGVRYRSSRHRTAALPHWLRYYNERRPHSSLGGLPPISRVHNVCEQDI
jgi:transposase InsO family protein